MYILRNLNVVREVRRERSRHRDGERRKRTVCRVADVMSHMCDRSQRIGECLARRVADRLENDHTAGRRQRIDRQGSVLEAEGEHTLERCIRRAEQVYRMKMFVDALANGRRLRVRQHKVEQERRKILHVRSGPDCRKQCRFENRKRKRVVFEERQKALFIEIAQLLRDLHVIVNVVEKLICDIEYIIGIRLATRQLVAHDVYQLDFAVGEAEARERRMLFPRSAANGKAVAHVGIANCDDRPALAAVGPADGHGVGPLGEEPDGEVVAQHRTMLREKKADARVGAPAQMLRPAAVRDPFRVKPNHRRSGGRSEFAVENFVHFFVFLS